MEKVSVYRCETAGCSMEGRQWEVVASSSSQRAACPGGGGDAADAFKAHKGVKVDPADVVVDPALKEVV